jgi:hypothetical protein
VRPGRNEPRVRLGTCASAGAMDWSSEPSPTCDDDQVRGQRGDGLASCGCCPRLSSDDPASGRAGAAAAPAEVVNVVASLAGRVRGWRDATPGSSVLGAVAAPLPRGEARAPSAGARPSDHEALGVGSARTPGGRPWHRQTGSVHAVDLGVSVDPVLDPGSRPDYERRYRKLLRQGRRLRRDAGYENANLKRGLTSHRTTLDSTRALTGN